MNLIESLKRVRQEVGLSSQFPITHLNSPSIFETRNGFLGSVIKVTGVPFITEDAGVLNALSHTLHQAIISLDARFISYVTIHRKKENSELDGIFSSQFAKRVNDKYHARFKNRALYKNHLYLTVLLKGDTSNAMAKVMGWFKRMGDIGSSDIKSQHRVERMQALTMATDQLCASLSKFNPELLGERDEERGHSELIEFLSLIPNGGETLPFRHGSHPTIAKSIPDNYLEKAHYPEGHLGQYVCAKELFSGEYFQFQGASKEDVRFAAILSLKKYGRGTSSVILDPLLSLDSEFIATHSFAPIAYDTALKTIEVKRAQLINAEDKGASQIQALSQLEDDLASEVALMGHHHNTLLLIAPTIKQLERAINNAVKVYAHIGVVVVKESPDFGAEPAFFAQIPGNHHLIARSSLITSRNFVDFCALHNYQTGFRDGNHLGGAVTLIETPSKTPVWFNYHDKGSRTNPSNGHTLILGGSDAGKTTFATFMDAQMGRYAGKTFFLDRNQASKIYILASTNSRYIVINPDATNTDTMNPLQLPDTKANRSFIKTWFASLLKREGEVDLPADITREVNECVDYNFEHLDKPYRQLSHLVKILPVSFERWPELQRFLKGNDLIADGDYAWIFDNEKDALELGFDKVGFDITWLTDKASPLISMPVYLYLLHRMTESLDGRLTSILIDEAFKVLDSAFWREELKTMMATIRKANAHFIFITQSPETILTSAISRTIIDNVMTTIILPNSEASRTTYIEHLKLSETEFQAVLTNPASSRIFLYKQKNETILCRLDLSPLEEEIRVLSGNLASVQLMDDIRAEVGNEVEKWLPVFLARSAA